jgi:MFS transporter, FSR family, fosmidomycin resistance protein
VASTEAQAAPAALDRRSLGLLAVGHMSADLCQGAVPALLPFLIAERGYSYSAAASLVLAVTVGSAVIQPLFGHMADRMEATWLIPGGVATAGAGIALSGVAGSYALTFAAIAVAGVGVAAFHPEGARYANYASGSRKGSGMSLFSVGGNAGFALGPLLVTPCVLALGLPGTLVVGAVPLSAACLLAWRLDSLRRLRQRTARAASEAARGGDHWGAFARLTGVISLRSGVYFGLQAFLPAYFVAELHSSKAAANGALAVMLASGAVGTLIGGRLADRISPRTVLLVTLAALGPLVAAFLLAGHALAVPILVPIGMCTVGSFSITVLLGQAYLPSRLGTASGVTLGAAIGMGGVAAPLLGLLADNSGLEATMWTIALLPLPALALALTLPSRLGRPAAAVGA